ncbi:maker216 [Drosophila busckii]|uniref:Maker216 n=1 Tax=Drosophila busckii TaxID=30019 RepID=A0A0M4EUW9_DROBS|nr:uncharacterized protein LOC108602716 [Drosophila busckii]ALC46955.1 maker216 [Drosophila busckii]
MGYSTLKLLLLIALAITVTADDTCPSQSSKQRKAPEAKPVNEHKQLNEAQPKQQDKQVNEDKQKDAEKLQNEEKQDSEEKPQTNIMSSISSVIFPVLKILWLAIKEFFLHYFRSV